MTTLWQLKYRMGRVCVQDITGGKAALQDAHHSQPPQLEEQKEGSS